MSTDTTMAMRPKTIAMIFFFILTKKMFGYTLG